MPLIEYKQKRNFKKTTEPTAHSQQLKAHSPQPKAQRSSIYVIQKHSASHLHYDLRLEFNGVLRSWAIPKQPPKTKHVKRLAIEVEDHPISYAKFEGTIPEGNYGAGKVEIWDKGTFELIEKEPKTIVIKINGEKLNGEYCLVKTSYGAKPEKSWLFFKR